MYWTIGEQRFSIFLLLGAGVKFTWVSPMEQNVNILILLNILSLRAIMPSIFMHCTS